ncbi:mitochondrial enolase superfamily member 1 [Grus japonensis]|uniref:Mitochondrial enolase superfamily member 1 n=1 Tax=Grus japonensis TaxID=30415 RepID=A0ABC9VSI4_GRUJA
MGKSCLTNPTTFYDEMPGVADEGRAVVIVNFDFSKAFDTVSSKILKGKLMKYKLDVQAVKWIENWLKVTSGCTPGVNTGSSPA